MGGGSAAQLTCAQWVASYTFPASVTAPTCPTAPSTSGTETPGTCAEIDTAMAIGARIVRPDAGSYSCTGSQVSFQAADTWLDLSNGVTITVSSGDFSFGGFDRLKLSGGNVIVSAGDMDGFGGQHIEVSNMDIDLSSGDNFDTTGADNLALMYSDVTTGNYAYFSSPGFAQNDIVIAGNNLLGGESGTTSTFRIQDGTRVLIAQNRIDNNLGLAFLFRIWADSQDFLVVDNHSITNGAGGWAVWITTDCGTRPGDIDDIFIRDNSFYNPDDDAIIASASYDNGCASSCTDVEFDGNVMYTTPERTTFGVTAGADAACSNLVTTNNTTEPYSSEPSCATIGCGPDH